MTSGKVFGNEGHDILEQNLEIHGRGESTVEDLKRRGALARDGAPQMQRGLLSRLIRIGRLTFELIERRQERLERRLANENVLVEVILLMRLTPLNARLTMGVGEHGLAAHATIHKTVLFAIVARLLGRRRLEFLTIQILLHITVRNLFNNF